MFLEEALFWTRTFLSLLLIIQGFEMLTLHSKIKDSSPWSWKNVKDDLLKWPLFLQTLLDSLFTTHFKFLILIQLGSAFLLPFINSGFLIFLLFIIHLLISLRFRGCFNGGSDYMTTTILFGLLLNSIPLPEPFYSKVGLYYIALQSTFSYFIAGITKLQTPEWRSGLALKAFLTFSNYKVPQKLQSLAPIHSLMLFLCWSVILMEIVFPLIWFNKTLIPFYLSATFIFHLFTFIGFGLNRFVFAWLASYPAIIYCIP